MCTARTVIGPPRLLAITALYERTNECEHSECVAVVFYSVKKQVEPQLLFLCILGFIVITEM